MGGLRGATRRGGFVVLGVSLSLVTASACSGGRGNAATSGAPASASASSLPTTTSTSTSTSTTTTVPTAVPPPPRSKAAATALLLQPSEIGPDVVVDAASGPDQGPLLCGQPSVSQQAPPTFSARAGWGEGSGPSAFLDEEIAVYPDPDAASAAFSLMRAGVSCGHGTIAPPPSSATTLSTACARYTRQSSCPVSIDAPADIASAVGAQEAFEADVTGMMTAKVIAARVGSVVMTYRVAAGGTAPALRDASPIAAAGVQKILG